jgi:hypothetical protein
MITKEKYNAIKDISHSLQSCFYNESSLDEVRYKMQQWQDIMNPVVESLDSEMVLNETNLCNEALKQVEIYFGNYFSN